MSKSRRTSDLVNSLLVNPDNSVNIHEGTQSPYFLLDTTATPTLQPGMFGWNDAYGTADLRLKGNNVTLQVGQEILARVVNKTGADLLESDYKVVRVRIASEGGAQGQRLAVVLAQGDNDPDSVTTLGIVTENIPNNQEGFITVFGNVSGINTTGSLQGETWVDGDVLFLSPTTPGGLTKVKPQAPNHTVVMGYVVYAHNNQGKIFVKVDNGYELDELHNVLITNPQQDQVLKYDAASQVWVNGAGGGGTTPTLAQVTTAGNTTTNAITVGAITGNDGTVAQFKFSSGAAASTPTLAVANTGSGGKFAALVAGTSGSAFIYDNSGFFAIMGQPKSDYTGNNLGSGTAVERFRITGGGNVLIGTTTDSGFKLDVSGTVRATGTITADFTNGFALSSGVLSIKRVSSPILGVEFASTSYPMGFGFKRSTTVSSGHANGLYLYNFISFQSGTNHSYTELDINPTIQQYLGASPTSVVRGIHIRPVISTFTTTPYRAIEWNNNIGHGIYGSGTAPNYLNGNLLIGTTTDSGYKLDVAGTARIQNNLLVNGPSTFTDRIYLGDYGADTDTNYYIQSGGQVYIQANAFRANNFYTDLVLMSGTTSVSQIQIRGNDDSSGFIRFTVNNTEAARFFNNGDLAIGTTSDDGYKLNVNGVIAATGGTSTNWNTAYSWGNHATAGYLTSQPWVVSGSNIYYSTGNVGIGTTNPSLGKLHVEGTVYSTRYEVAQNGDLASADKGLRVQDNFGGTYQYNNSGPYTGHFTSYHIRDISATTMFYATSSAFGIGTLTPSHRLEVVGSSFIQAQIRSTDNAAGIKLVPSAGHNYEIQATNDNKFLIYNRSTGTFSFTINSAHNVGIGTLNPAYKLDVEGSSRVYSLRVETNYPSIEIRNTTGPAVVGYVTTRQALVGGSFGNNELTLSSQGNAMPFYVSVTNKLKFELTDYLNTGSWNRTAILRDVYPSLIFNSNDTKWGGIAYDYTGGMALWVNASSVDVSATNPVMYITNAGNIGIGTSSATQGKLVIAAPDESTASAISIRQSNDLNFGMDIGLDQTVNGNGYFYSVSSGSKYEFLQFSRTTVPNVFLVGSGGNVGIGTSSPGYKLDISQPNVKVQIRATNENENATLFFGTPFAGTSAPKTAIIAKGMTNWSRADLYFCLNISQASNSVEVSTADAKMVILNEGNVGIGTTTPGYKLEVNGAGRFTGILRADNAIDSYGSVASHRLFTGSSVFAGGIGLSSWTGRGGSDVDIYSVGNIAFQTNDTSVPKMYINTTGNIGIATTSPNSKLHIFGGTQNWNETIPGQTVGTIHLAPNSNASDFGNAITFGAIDWNSGGDAQAGIYVKASGGYGTKMYFATTNSFATGSRTRMMINNDGKVAINTTVPAGVLTVNVGNGGTSGTSGVTVYGTGNYLSLEMGIEGGYDGMIRTYGNDLLLYGGHWRTVGTVASEDHSIKFFTTKNGSANWSTAKMILNHNGNLGIGTTNPTYKLQVNGTGGVAIADGGAQLDIVPATYFIGSILSGNGVSISPEGSDRHLRLLTSTSGAPSKISIGYFKAGPGWYAALHVDSSETNPPLLLQAQGNNVVIGGTVDSGDKLRVYGTVHADQFMSNSQLGLTIDIPTGAGQTLHFEGGILTNVS